MTEEAWPHTSVLLEESLAGFAGLPIRTFFDGTVGAGGHAEAFLSAHPEIELYIGCDQDPVALELASKRLARWGERVKLVQSNFAQLDEVIASVAGSSAGTCHAIDGFFLT